MLMCAIPVQFQRRLKARCITNGDCVGRGTCVLRGGCIAVAEKFFGRVTIYNPVTGVSMILADKLRCPAGIIQAPDTSIIVTCWSAVIRVQLTGEVTTLCGCMDSTGFADGKGSAARFNNSTSIALHHANTGVLVNDRFNGAVRSVMWDGTVTTVVPEQSNMIENIVACPDGSYLFDGRYALMKLDAAGSVTTLVGNGSMPPDYIGVDGVGEGATVYNVNSICVSSRGIAVYCSCWSPGHLRLVDVKTGAVQTFEHSAPDYHSESQLDWRAPILAIQKDGTMLLNVRVLDGTDADERMMFKLKLDNIPSIGCQYSTFKGWGAAWLKPTWECISMCSPKVKAFMRTILLVATRADGQTLASIGRRSTRAVAHWQSLVLPIELWYYIITMVLPPPCSALP